MAAKEEEKQGFLSRVSTGIRRYFSETIGELKKVNWPSRKEATNLTIVVLIVLVVMSVYLGLLDVIFSQLMGLIFSTG